MYGSVLILAMIVAGLTFVLLTGMSTLEDAKDFAQYKGAEQAFTVADSRFSKARFSTSIFQEAPFAVRDGTVVVDGTWDNSHIIVYDINDTRELYNGTLGTIRFITDSGEIAYQDGGVWATGPNGGSIMISPPLFNYNGVTLTLPIIKMDGNASVGVAGNLESLLWVNSSEEPRVIYPKEGVGGNPVPPGNIINITIKSDYYEAWASYINDRTRANAVTDPSRKIVNVSLSTGIPMQSGLVSMGFTTKAMDTSYEAPITVFKLNLFLRNTGNDYTITYGVPGPNKQSLPDPELLMTVSRTTGSGNKEYAYIEYKYTHGGQVETFSTMLPFERKADESMDLDMLNKDIQLTYDGTSPNTITWGSDPDIMDSSFSTDYDDPSMRDVSIGEEKTLHDVTQHYLWLMAEWDQKNGETYNGPFYDVIGKDKYDGGQSTFQLGYQSSQDIKYLYITEGVLKTSLCTSG